MLQFLFDTDHLTLYEHGAPLTAQAPVVKTQASGLLSGGRATPAGLALRRRLKEPLQAFQDIRVVPLPFSGSNLSAQPLDRIIAAR